MKFESMWRQAVHVMTQPDTVPHQDDIAALAYAKYLERGQGPCADPTGDWLEAEAELRRTRRARHLDHRE